MCSEEKVREYTREENIVIKLRERDKLSLIPLATAASTVFMSIYAQKAT